MRVRALFYTCRFLNEALRIPQVRRAAPPPNYGNRTRFASLIVAIVVSAKRSSRSRGEPRHGDRSLALRYSRGEEFIFGEWLADRLPEGIGRPRAELRKLDGALFPPTLLAAAVRWYSESSAIPVRVRHGRVLRMIHYFPCECFFAA